MSMVMPKREPGSYYLGQPGHLLQVDGSHGGLVRSWSDGVTIHDGGEAPRYAHLGTRRQGRTWQVGLDFAHTREISALHELHSSLTAPFVMVDPWAQVTNVLTPEASLVLSSSLPRVGGMLTIDGEQVPSMAYNATASASNVAPVWAGAGPVLPGHEHTASVWTAGPYASNAQLLWADANNQPISWFNGPTVTGSDRLRRATVTATAPANAVAAYTIAVRARYVARAALTWTSEPTDWGIGGYAQQAVITDVQDGILHAVPGSDERMRRAGVSFTITELGV